MTTRHDVRGRLVLDDRVVVGRLAVEDGWIAAVDLEDNVSDEGSDLPYIAPGFVDVHVHGWGGHDVMGSAEALDGMARALLAHGVTSFLPTGVTSPLPVLHEWTDRVRAWIPAAPANGADPLGFNLEGPFLSQAKKGAHNPELLLNPADVPWSEIEPLVDGLSVMTVAPTMPVVAPISTPTPMMPSAMPPRRPPARWPMTSSRSSARRDFSSITPMKTNSGIASHW